MTTEKKTKRRYTEEFKRDAVSLVTEQGYSAVDASRSLGINTNLIYKWRKDFTADTSNSDLSSSEREELSRLRKEIKRLHSTLGYMTPLEFEKTA